MKCMGPNRGISIMDQIMSGTATFARAPALNNTMMYMGSIMSFLVRGDETAGRFSMVEYRSRPGNEPPPHLHE